MAKDKDINEINGQSDYDSSNQRSGNPNAYFENFSPSDKPTNSDKPTKDPNACKKCHGNGVMLSGVTIFGRTCIECGGTGKNTRDDGNMNVKMV